MKIILILIFVFMISFVQAGWTHIEPSLAVSQKDGVLTINDLTISTSDALVFYSIPAFLPVQEKPVSIKAVYIPTIFKSSEVDEVEFILSKPPKRTTRVFYDYPFTLYEKLGLESLEELEEYCKKNPQFCEDALGHYYILGYDGFDINLKKIDLVTGRKYTTKITENGYKMINLEGETSFSANDFVISGTDLWCNGNCHLTNLSGDIPTSLYGYLNNTAPQCAYFNNTKAGKNVSNTIETFCNLHLNVSANLNSNFENLIFNQDDPVIGGSGCLYVNNDSNLTMLDGLLNFNSLQVSASIFHIMQEHDGVVNETQYFENMLLEGGKSNLPSSISASCLNATMKKTLATKFGLSGQCFDASGSLINSIVRGEDLIVRHHAISWPVDLSGTMKLHSDTQNFFVFSPPADKKVTSILDFPEDNPAVLEGVYTFFVGGVGVVANPLEFRFNITNVKVIRTGDMVVAFGFCDGVFRIECLDWDIRIFQTQKYRLQESGSGNNIQLDGNCTSNSSVFTDEKYSQRTTTLDVDMLSYRHDKDVFEAGAGVDEDFYDGTCNITDSNGVYFPVDMIMNITVPHVAPETFLKIPYSITLKPGSDFGMVLG